MKVKILDAHDRYQHLVQKPHSVDIGECCQDLINKRPFGEHPFYIFSHARTEDDGTTRLIWQPRLTKPKAQSNSLLFKVYPGSDVVKVVWMIPKEELWPEFEYGKMCQNKTVFESIHNFRHNRAALEAKEDDDLSEEAVENIYREISYQARRAQA